MFFKKEQQTEDWWTVDELTTSPTLLSVPQLATVSSSNDTPHARMAPA